MVKKITLNLIVLEKDNIGCTLLVNAAMCVIFLLSFLLLLFLINQVCENLFFIFRNSWFFRGTRPLVGLGHDKESLTLTRIDREVARRILWVGIDRLI